MKLLRKALTLTLAASLTWMPVRQAAAEDIDLFVSGTASSVDPNILVIIDNSANWSAANQRWPGGVKQGQSELRALRTVLNEIRPGDSTSSRVNLGLMMFTAGQGSDIDGGYIRFHVRPMTQTNVDRFKELIGDPAVSTCSGNNSLTGAPNCIYHNFNNPFENTANADIDYSAALFEAFKYFGGYTDVANAQADRPGAPPSGAVPPHTFGVTRRSGTIPSDQTSNEYRKFDSAAYSADKASYVSPIGATNSCAKNYIILIGNGFPTSEPTAWDTELLFNVNQPSTQLAMPQFTSTSALQTSTLTGSFCGTGNNAGQQKTACEGAIPQATKDANPADTYTCVNPRVNITPCTGADNALFDVQAAKTVITVTATGTFAVPATAKIRYADEWAKFLASTDVSSAAGQQSIATYTIDVFKDAQDADQTALLNSMARYGGGKYFQATSEEAIINALRQILIEIQSVNTVFASASLPINATNRSQNENQVFIGMFRPDGGGRPRWFGNLKRYQIALFSGLGKLADADGNEAVGPTGFVGPCARSFWTSDTGDYWNFTQSGQSTSFAGLCSTAGFSLFSDKPDGSQVEKGAVAEVLRRGNNPPYTDRNLPNVDPIVTPAPASVNRTMLTCQNNNATTTFDDTLVTCNIGSALHPFSSTTIPLPAALRALNIAERDLIINFTRGEDISADQANQNQNQCPAGTACTTDPRPDIHGDVAHSRALPVNYGGSTGVVLYYGANDGTFRAVQGSDGKELWAFIAPEHHPRLKRLRDNEPRIKYPPSTDTSQQPKDYFFDGSAGVYQTFDSNNIADKVWVFPSMRRGGRMLYGFDVTTPIVTDSTGPRMKWRIGCPNLANDIGCSTGFTDLGQTWSTPSVARIKGYDPDNDATTDNPVIIVGGGYDSCEDNDAAATTCSSPKGNRVYVLDAGTGAIIRTFGGGGVSPPDGTIDRSIAADVTLVDRALEGYAQHAYVVDTGGSLYRIDFVDPSTLATRAEAAWTLTKIAQTTGASRKFLFAPAALPSTGKVFLTVGSGDRERPLIRNYPYTTTSVPTAGDLGIQNRFYMFIDTFPPTVVDATPPATGTVPAPPVNLDTMENRTTVSVTSCGEQVAVGQNGWFIELNAGRGEQTVTSSLIFGGLVFFSTNRPQDSTTVSCTNNLGEARGYAVNLLNASGAVGTETLCGGSRSGIFLGGGLPPSPVTGTVPIGGRPVTVMIGGIDRSGAVSSPIGAQRVRPSIAQQRSRIYWYRQGDK